MSEKYAKALDKLIDARDEIARLRTDLARVDKRLEDALALLGEWQALPIVVGDGGLRISTRKFMEADDGS